MRISASVSWAFSGPPTAAILRCRGQRTELTRVRSVTSRGPNRGRKRVRRVPESTTAAL